MLLELLSDIFAICKVKQIDGIDFSMPYVFYARTDKEMSLVCLEKNIPKDAISVDRYWCAIRFAENMEFSKIGVLSAISAILAKNNISIFAVSTFDTDYILVKSDVLGRALQVLVKNGYRINDFRTVKQ